MAKAEVGHMDFGEAMKNVSCGDFGGGEQGAYICEGHIKVE